MSAFGVDRFSTADQWSRLKAATQAAAAERFDLVADPDASYRHDGPLLLHGVSLDGRGCALVALSDGPQTLQCTGAGWRVANLRLLGAATRRSADDRQDGLFVGGDDTPATDFVLENVTVDAVAPGRGVGGAGMMFNNAARGRISRPVVRHSLSDGIHVTNGSHHLAFSRPLSEGTGDDGFAVVSYRRQGRLCRAIDVSDGIVRDSAARGFVVVGGADVAYRRMLVERSAAAGAYLYGEAPFDTFGVARCRIAAPVLRGCVTGRGLPDGFSNAALIIGGREGWDMVDGARVARGAADCVVTDAVIEGAGRACTAGVSLHQFAIRPRVARAHIRDMTAPPGAPLQPNGVEIGGRDVVVEAAAMTGIAGVALVIGRTASGACLVSAPVVDHARTGPGAINSFIYADAAPALTRATVSGGRFSHGPDRLAISLLPPGRLRLANDRMG